jgi:mannose-6-phosphate isomerase
VATSHNHPKLSKIDLTLPVPLDPQNFTSISRTPWSGSALAKGIKKNQATSASQRIGEAWEVSCDPEAPSKLQDAPDCTLAELIKQRTAECLSERMVTAGGTSLNILVKLINASSPLSLQIHPADDSPLLNSNECGKPESWLVLSAEKGSGIYIGFQEGLTLDGLRQHLENGTFSSDLLQFVPVQTGDYFEIDPHVPHAIGPGVVLLEPQRITSGMSGKTWRLWDWDRKYNSKGELDAEHGRPRDLHIKESISIISPSDQSGTKYVDRLRRNPKRETPAPGVSADIFPANKWYQTILLKLDAGANVQLKSDALYACATILEGCPFSFSGHSRGRGSAPKLEMPQGQSFFIPASALPNTLAAEASPALLSLIIPAGLGVEDHLGNIFSV